MSELKNVRYGNASCLLHRTFLPDAQLLTERGYVFLKDLVEGDKAWDGSCFRDFSFKRRNVSGKFIGWYLEVDGGASVVTGANSDFLFSNNFEKRRMDVCFDDTCISKTISDRSVLPQFNFPVLKSEDSYISERAILDAYVEGCAGSRALKTMEDWNAVQRYSFSEKLSWLEGFVKVSGSFNIAKDKYRVMQFSGTYEFLQGLMLFFNTLGVDARISSRKRLAVSHKNLQKLAEIGFKNEKIVDEGLTDVEIRDKVRFNKVVLRRLETLESSLGIDVCDIISEYPIVVNGLVFG